MAAIIDLRRLPPAITLMLPRTEVSSVRPTKPDTRLITGT